MKKALFGIVVLVVVLFAARDGLRFYRAYTTQDATPTPTPIPTPTPSFRPMALGTPEPIANENISVFTPQKNAVVSLPFSVTGKARVFEATVALSLKDGSGRELYRDIAMATAPDPGEAGPFTKIVNYLFEKPQTPEATLEVFWSSPKDGQVLDLLRIPVTLGLGNLRDVKIFFSPTAQDGAHDCSKVVSVSRVIPQGVAPATGAMELLIHGLSPKESDAGYATALPGFLRMPRIAISQGTATVDFSQDAKDLLSDACRLKAFRAQVEQTLYQFSNISGVAVSVDGNTLGG